MNDDKVTTIIAADYMYLVFLGDDNTISKIMNKLNNQEITEHNKKNLHTKKITESINKQKNKNKINKSANIYVKYEISNPCIELLDDEQVHKILLDDAKKSISKKSVPINKAKTITDNMSYNNNMLDNTPYNNSEINTFKKYVILDEGVEAAQCLTYADISSSEISSKNKNNNNNNTHSTKMFMLMAMINHDTHFKLSFPILQLDEEENPDKLIGKWLQDNDIEDIIKELTIRPVNIVGNEHEILVFTAHIITS